MKKFMMNNRLLVAALAISALTACNNETNEDGLDGRTPLAVTGSSIAESRATDNAWEKKDAIGVTLFEAGTSNIVLDNPKAGKYITAQGNGAFEPADKANTLYYPTQNKKADIVAFYPYANLGADLKVPVNVANQTKLSAIDLMVADKVKGKSAADGEVSLTFRHKLVKIDLSIDCTQSAANVDLSKATVALHGTPATAEWSLSTGTLKTGAAATIDIPTVYKGNKLTATAIVIPCDVKGVKLVVTAGDRAYDVPFTSNMVLTAGTKNTLRVHLAHTEATVEASIEDWTTGVEADLANLQVVVSGTPDTLDGEAPTFNSMTLYVADEEKKDFSLGADDATLGEAHIYTFANDVWSSTAPIYLDFLKSTTVIYGMTTNSTADAVTGLTDILGTDATAVKGGVAAFTFRHLLAQMSITLAQGEGFTPSLDGAVITTPAMIKGYTIATDADANMTAVAGTETQAYTLTDDDAHLVVSQTLAKGSVFTVKLSNGNTYTAALAEAVTLEAEKNTTITLTLNTTATGVKVAMTDWGTAAAEAAMKLAGLTDGTVTYAANEGDILNVYYDEVSTDAVQGSFKYENNAWTSNTPLYWDEIAQTGYTGQFIAVLTPAAKTTPFADFFVGKTTGVTFGSEVDFELQHAAAQFSFVIKAGTGIDDINTEVPTRTLTLGEGDATGMNADGTINYGTLTNKNYTIGTEALFVTPQTLTDSHVVTLTRANGNKYTVKLTDLMNGTDKLFTGGKVEAGKHYTITLTVNESTVGITAGIADWTDVEGSGTAKPEF